MNLHDLLLALLLPLPPWLGYLLHRYRGRVSLAFGYFLGGVLAVLSLPWPQIGSRGLPIAHLGGALFGFTLFLQAHREGRTGVRNLSLGVAGATFFAWIVGTLVGLNMHSVLAFWGTALLEAGLWLLLSDLGYRLTQGRWLSVRMPVAGGLAFLVATALFRFLPLGVPPLSWPASLLAGLLLGFVALQQLVWLRTQGVWVEGRGDGLRVALSALEADQPPEGPTLAYVIDARQPMILVNDKGLLLETNTAFSRLAGFPRHQMKGYQLQDFFQGRDAAPWEALREQLLQESRGSVLVTLVHKDSTFQSVRLEAVPFDRSLALVWIADAQPGTLALRGHGSDPVLQESLAGNDPNRAALESLSAILPEVEQILGETWNSRTRAAAERIILAARNLAPGGSTALLNAPLSQLQARPALEAAVTRLRPLLGPRLKLAWRTPDMTLFIGEEPLQRLVTQLVLQGRQTLSEGTLTLTLDSVTLANRTWARLGLQREGTLADPTRKPPPPPGEWLGLSWLQQTVRASLGMLELQHDDLGQLQSKIYLPCRNPDSDPAAACLRGRRIWILDPDPEVRDSLCTLVRNAEGQATGFEQLRALTQAARQGLPDLLVLERTPELERFHRGLSRAGIPALPCLILGEAKPLPPGHGAPSRLILLEKPFPGQNFLQCLLALLQPS